MPLTQGSQRTARITAYGTTAEALVENAELQAKSIFGEDWTCEFTAATIEVAEPAIGRAPLLLCQEYLVRATYRP